ncbi:MAG: hypothetical protein K2N88_05585 [Muribaculaceae bacterium]|nr:hypothetical protein [Muribaculaceae bacterium]
MNLSPFANPQRTYDGYFEAYFIRPFFHRYANFTAHESMGYALMSLAAWLIVTIGIAGIMMGQIGIIGPEAGVTATIVVGCVWAAFSITPIIALLKRASLGENSLKRTPHFLGVDTLLLVSCVLFFIFGLLMMLTTLNSEILKPNARYNPAADTVKAPEAYIVEEPIFTYQSDAPAPAVEEDNSQEEGDGNIDELLIDPGSDAQPATEPIETPATEKSAVAAAPHDSI